MSDWRPFEIFLQSDNKNGQKRVFLLFGNLLEFLVLEPISRVPPCESSRPGDSENVVLFGRATFLMGVIAAQSQQTLKFCLRPRK